MSSPDQQVEVAASNFMPLSNDELRERVQEWAEREKVEEWKKTVACEQKPRLYRTCLIRLVELRCEADVEWRNTLPLSVLEETNIRIQLREKTGKQRVLEIAGKKVKNRALGFKTLNVLTQEGLGEFLDVHDQFDLVQEQ